MNKFAFKEWLAEEGYATGGKLGLYPPIADALGQYPPLHAIARIPDVITYIDIAYGSKGPPGEGGFIRRTARDMESSATTHKSKNPLIK